LFDAIIEKNSGRNASPAPTSLHAVSGNSMPKGGGVIDYLLFVIGGREEEVSGQWSAVIRKDGEAASSKRGMGGPPVSSRRVGILSTSFHKESFTAKPPFLRKETEDDDVAFSIATQ
jgi:hypothetical protein